MKIFKKIWDNLIPTEKFLIISLVILFILGALEKYILKW